jgi:pimeloyl-ACP methyl ester carboxylesterase
MLNAYNLQLSISLRRIVFSLACASLLLLAAGPAVAAPVRRSVPWPQSDPFYTPPSGYESSAPGTILRTRLIPSPLAGIFSQTENVANAWQILYRTTDALGNAIATVTTLIEPHNATSTKVLSYQIAEDSAAEQCAPSYTLQSGAGGTSSSLDLMMMDAALNQGWYVTTPDYEGPNSVFTCGPTSGQGVLDSIRAVLASTSVTGLQPTAGVVLWGYSGGALATGWAAELQPTYAPELKLLGAAMGGTPSDLNATVNAVNKGPFAGLIPAGFLGLSQQYPDLNTYIQSQLIPSKAAAFNNASKQCLGADSTQFANQDIFSYFNPNFMNGAPASTALANNKMGNYVPKIPLWMYHAIHDEVVPFAPTQALVSKYCSEGANIQFTQDELSEHIILDITGAADAFTWLKARLSETPLAAGCTTRTTASEILDPGAVLVFGSIIFNGLTDLLGEPIGPTSIS